MAEAATNEPEAPDEPRRAVGPHASTRTTRRPSSRRTRSVASATTTDAVAAGVAAAGTAVSVPHLRSA